MPVTFSVLEAKSTYVLGGEFQKHSSVELNVNLSDHKAQLDPEIISKTIM